MKITIVFQFLSTNKGSFSSRLFELGQHLKKKGFDVTFITSTYYKSDLIKPKYLYSTTLVNDIKIISLNTSSGNDRMFVLRVFNSILFSIISSLIVLFSNTKIVLCSSGPITSGLPVILSKILKPNIKTAFEIRDLWPHGMIDFGIIKSKIIKEILFGFEKKIYHCSDKIITLSEGQKNFLNNKYKNYNFYTSSQISDLDLFDTDFKYEKNKISSYGKYLIYFGGLDKIHNIQYWIDLFSLFNEVEKKEFNVLFFGEWEFKQKLESISKANKLINIFFLGSVPKIELVKWIKFSYGTLFSTTHHSTQQNCSPNKIFDSFAAGKPIIQTTKGWIKDLVEIENCGINLSLDDLSKSRLQLLDFIRNVDKQLVQSQNSLNLAKNKFDKSIVFDEYINQILK